MKILISSLQVSNGASKGHLHPAIEIGLELQRRGHIVAILSLPSPLSQEDREQIERCQFEIIEPPILPKGLPLPPEELALLAKNPATTAKAYHSFLLAPLEHQFESIYQKIQIYKPDIIVYDLLVYAPALIARLLNIPDIGYCAGLKLIAPNHLTIIYQTVREELTPVIDGFLKRYSVEARFHHLELLSSTYQLVFTQEQFIDEKDKFYPSNTVIAGSLPISSMRYGETNSYSDENKKNIVLCFGSVLDPADYMDITNLIIKISNQFKCNLIISSRKLDFIPSSMKLRIEPYLHLNVVKKASVFIHHGGANTFSESLTLGIPQLLIPLTTDQPIQAELLNRSQAGIAIYPSDLTEENLIAAFQKLLNSNDPIHNRIKQMKMLFQESQGAVVASNLIEQVVNSLH